MSGRVVKYNLDPLHQFVKSAGNNNVVRVGIFGEKSSRKKGAITNAEVGAINEYGSFTRGIPARSFLRMPIHNKSQEILKEASAGVAELFAAGKHMVALKRLGIACENAIQRAFASRGFGTWKPNAPSTIARKKSSQPLIDTSQLRRAITSKVV